MYTSSKFKTYRKEHVITLWIDADPTIKLALGVKRSLLSFLGMKNPFRNANLSFLRF